MGTDMLVASWLFAISSVLYLALIVELIIDDGSRAGEIVELNNYAQLVSAILFFFGSCYFVYVSYPEAVEKAWGEMQATDLSNMSWLQRYFTGNDFLKATWFFCLASTPYLVDAINIIAVEPGSYVGYAFFVGVSIYFMALSIWVLGCMPENMVANDGRGSSLFFDYIFSNLCCCTFSCKPEEFWRKHFGADFLAGSWIFFICSACSVPISIFEVISSSGADPYYWLMLAMTVGFTAGAGLFVVTSYPENMMTTKVYDSLCACCTDTHGKRSEDDGNAEETADLL